MSVETEQIGWTFERFITELAASVNLSEFDATTRLPKVPDNAVNLERLKRAINRGYRSFLLANPSWTFLERTVTMTLSPGGTSPLCVDGAAWRYRLPLYVSGPAKGDWRFTDQRVLSARMMTIDARSVAEMHEIAPRTTGIPIYAGSRPLDPDGGTGRQSVGWELVVYPNPSEAYILATEYRVTPPELVELDDRAIGGPEHDLALFEQAEFEYRRLDDRSLQQPTGRLLQSIAFDNAQRSRRIGPPGSQFISPRAQRTPIRIETVPGVSL